MLKRSLSLLLALLMLSSFLLSRDVDGDQYEGQGVEITSIEDCMSAGKADDGPAFSPLRKLNTVVEFDVAFIPVTKKWPVVPPLVITLPLTPCVTPILVMQEVSAGSVEARGPPRISFLFSPLGLRGPPFVS